MGMKPKLPEAQVGVKPKPTVEVKPKLSGAHVGVKPKLSEAQVGVKPKLPEGPCHPAFASYKSRLS